MNNQLISLQVKERLNKLSSNDYDNIECWQIVEAFNKTQLEFSSIKAERGEESKAAMDTIGFLIQTVPLKGVNQKEFYESVIRPSNYMSYKRISFEGVSPSCPQPRSFVTYLGEESEKDILYRDSNKNPSFEWAETFITFIGDRFRIHTDGKFTVQNATLTYYRKPLPIQILGCVNPETGQESTIEQQCEFKDDIIQRFLIPGTIAQLSGDIESLNQYQINLQNLQRNQ